jgi:hypothetical protein
MVRAAVAGQDVVAVATADAFDVATDEIAFARLSVVRRPVERGIDRREGPVVGGQVVARAAYERVGPLPLIRIANGARKRSLKPVVPGPAVDGVVAGPAVEAVVPVTAVDLVRALRAACAVRPVTEVDHDPWVPLADDRVLAAEVGQAEALVGRGGVHAVVQVGEPDLLSALVVGVVGRVEVLYFAWRALERHGAAVA